MRTWILAGLFLFLFGGKTAAGGEETPPPGSMGGDLPGADLSMEPYRRSATLDDFVRLWEKLDFFGDLRFRYQADFNRNLDFDARGNPSDKDRHRGLLRLRFGLRYPFHENLRFETRFRTRDEAADPRNDDLRLNRAWKTGDIGLDLMNLTFSPSTLGLDWLWFKGGKFEQIFTVNPVLGGLVWDPDLNPEGAALGAAFRSDEGVLRLFRVVTGGYLAIEQDRAKDAAAFTAQATAGLDFGESLGGELGAAFTGFNDTTPDGDTAFLDRNDGNQVANGEFVSDFHIWDSYGAVRFDLFDQPCVASGEWILNTGAKNDRDRGWAAGVAVGERKKAGDLRAFYQYQAIEQDALFTPIAREDFPRFSNYRGHVLGGTWRLLDNMDLAATWSWARAIRGTHPFFTEPRDETRFRLDLNIYF